jgi:hypothetical protein
VAVSTVGSVVVDAASKVIRGRGRPSRKATNPEGTTETPSESPDKSGALAGI